MNSLPLGWQILDARLALLKHEQQSAANQMDTKEDRAATPAVRVPVAPAAASPQSVPAQVTATPGKMEMKVACHHCKRVLSPDNTRPCGLCMGKFWCLRPLTGKGCTAAFHGHWKQCMKDCSTEWKTKELDRIMVEKMMAEWKSISEERPVPEGFSHILNETHAADPNIGIMLQYTGIPKIPADAIFKEDFRGLFKGSEYSTYGAVTNRSFSMRQIKEPQIKAPPAPRTFYLRVVFSSLAMESDKPYVAQTWAICGEAELQPDPNA